MCYIVYSSTSCLPMNTSHPLTSAELFLSTEECIEHILMNMYGYHLLHYECVLDGQLFDKLKPTSYHGYYVV